MRKLTTSFIVILLILGTSASSSYAYWVWSPDLGKWVNPKKSAKDTPEDQFTWAMGYYSQKDWDKAIDEFEKVPANFPNSKLAAEAVYYQGLCWQEKNDVAKAADSFKTVIDRYPYSDRIKDAIKHEFDIANDFASGEKVKVLGIPALPGQEKAIELYKHIVKNAPFGTYGDQAQFKIGDVYKAEGEFEESQKAYQAVIDEYANSELVPQARYQIAYVAMLASKKSEYNEQYSQRAIDEFQGFKNTFPQDKKAVEADEAIKALREKKAQAMFDSAAFYEKNDKYKSARVSYQLVVEKYPDTATATRAKVKIDEMVKKETEPEKKPGFSLPAIPKLKLW